MLENSEYRGVTFRHWTELKDLDPNMQWVVDDLLLSGGSAILVAQPKVGKTTLLYHLADCITNGKPFLGRKVRQGPVAMLLLEGHAGMHKKHLRDFGIAENDDVFVHAGPLGDTGLEGLFQGIQRMKSPPVIVIVDTLFRLVRVEDGNAYAPMVAAIEPLTLEAEKLGCHFLFAHHASKGATEGSAGLQALGSTAIAGGFDTILTLQRRGADRYIESEVRFGTEIPRSKLILDTDACEFRLGQPIAEALQEETEGEILEELGDGEKTLAELKAAIRSNRLSAVLGTLVEKGRVHRSKSDRKGKPFVYKSAE